MKTNITIHISHSSPTQWCGSTNHYRPIASAHTLNIYICFLYIQLNTDIHSKHNLDCTLLVRLWISLQTHFKRLVTINQ